MGAARGGLDECFARPAVAPSGEPPQGGDARLGPPLSLAFPAFRKIKSKHETRAASRVMI